MPTELQCYHKVDFGRKVLTHRTIKIKTKAVLTHLTACYGFWVLLVY